MQTLYWNGWQMIMRPITWQICKFAANQYNRGDPPNGDDVETVRDLMLAGF